METVLVHGTLDSRLRVVFLWDMHASHTVPETCLFSGTSRVVTLRHTYGPYTHMEVVVK